MSISHASLGRRYAAKLGTNLFGMVFNFINVSLVPRALGPVAYGNFEFLLSFFQQLVGFIDTGTSSAFYNKLSRRNEDVGLIRTYGKFVIAVFFLLLVVLGFAWLSGFNTEIWPAQEWRFILLAALLGYITWVSEVLRKIVDAYGCTIRGESALLLGRALGTLAVVILFLGSWLSLTSLLAMAWVAKELVGFMNFSMISNFVVSGIVYTGLVCFWALVFPASLGTNRAEIDRLANKLRATVARRFF